MLVRHDGFRRLCRARELLAQLDDPQPTIEALAREVRISPYHFIRQFEALFGVTPHQYRIQVRLDRAKQLLAAQRRSVTGVCMEVGFSSLGSFSALFSRRVGEAPRDYRRRVQPANLVPGCLTLMANLPNRSFREVDGGEFHDTPDNHSRSMHAHQADEHHGG
ncbi:MAG TPA: AraC family transcriptional regulator [Gemmatimonadales bacterium]|nr:AraC family transcriptional regulator [Gemmatimonadales bacterium]